MTEDPQGDVEVGASEGPIEGHILLNGRKELVALREPPIILEEPLLALGGGKLHADAHLRPGAVEPSFSHRGQDPSMDMLEVR